ncbi:MAG: LacI family DNA-binding transcriptional regulator [Succiniclasticum sp.]|jgi:LacI family transcriptional regulator|nr:LacI family DNA-binding transcriptional regulator [Succiniclasticum sp.]
MATMRDVALLAGVSTATVSHVINGSKNISAETTERVLQAISQVNYKPNTLAKSLRMGQSHTIGVLVEDIRGLPVASIVSGISETLAKGGYKTILHDLHLLEKLYNQYEQIGSYRQRINDGLSLLQSANVDGIIYVAMHDRHLDYLFDEMDIPLVFAYSHGTEKDTYITYSNRDSAADIIRFLIGKGHKHIAVIAGHPHSYPTAQRLLGIQMAMQQAGLSLPQEYIRYGNWEYESGMVQTGELLRLPIRPTAIFAMNDLMAAGCMAVLTSEGLRIPQDIAVAGFDNREIAEYLQPPLTTVALPTTEIGVQAALHIIDMISNPRIHPAREIINCSIVERASV